MNHEIVELLVRLGCNPANSGFILLHDAIQIYMDAYAVKDVPKSICKTLADRYDGKFSAGAVDHAIRATIESACNNDIDGTIAGILGQQPDFKSGKYTNIKFIGLCALKLMSDQATK